MVINNHVIIMTRAVELNNANLRGNTQYFYLLFYKILHSDHF